MGRWRDPDAHTHRLGHRKAIMEIGRYEPVKGDRLGSGRPGVAAAAMETDRYGPVKVTCCPFVRVWVSAPQWRPTATGR